MGKQKKKIYINIYTLKKPKFNVQKKKIIFFFFFFFFFFEN